VRRLPILVLLAVAFILVIKGGFFGPIGFEGSVRYASFAGQGSTSCGITNELRWFVHNGVYIVEITGGQKGTYTGYVKAAPVYYTYVDGGNWYTWSWPCFRFTATGSRPYDHVVLWIGANTQSLNYVLYIDAAAGVAVCDSGNRDPLCDSCSNIVYDVAVGHYICADYFLFNVSYVRVDFGGVKNCAVYPQYLITGGSPRHQYTGGGRNIAYVSTYDACGSQICTVTPQCTDGGQYPITATAAWDISPNPATIPIGVPPQIPVNYQVVNNAPFVMTNDDLLARLNTWSRPFKTVYAQFVVMGCDACVTDYQYLCQVHAPAVIAGWYITSSTDAKEALSASFTSGGTDVANWVAVPRGQCKVLFTVDVGPVYTTQLEYSQYQEVSYVDWMWIRRYDRASEAAITGLVGERKPFTLYLPPAHAITAYGDVALRVVGEYMDVPDWVRPYAAPLCPTVEGNKWPGLTGACYGAKIAGIVANGVGYVVLS